MGTNIHVANLALPQEGRNLHYAVVKRLLEAHDRGYWNPDEDVLEKLRDIIGGLEDRQEKKATSA